MNGGFTFRLGRLRKHARFGAPVRAGWRTGQWIWHRVSRGFAIRRYLAMHSVPGLHIGAGGPEPAGWLNTDLNPGRLAMVRLDATAPFPLPDASFRFVFSEHMIEHVPLGGARRMLAECFRVLARGGWIRTATPDLLQVTRLQTDSSATDVRRYLELAGPRYGVPEGVAAAAYVVNGMFHGHGHCFLYDEKALTAELRAAGFTDLRRCRPGMSTIAELQGLERHHLIIGVEANDYETLVLEARKP